MKILFLIISLISISNAKISVSLNGCERTKACFKSSRYCSVNDCEFIMTWQPIRFLEQDFIEFEIIGKVHNNDYILFGFSEDKTLGNDGFVSCYMNNSNVNIVAGVNENYDGSDIKIKIISDKTLIITSVNDRFGGIYNSYTERLICRFLRRINPLQAAEQLKDLSSGKEYFLIFDRGKVTEINFEKTSLSNIVFSDISVDLSRGPFHAISGCSLLDSLLPKLHGILMVIAWIFCSSVGIIMVRYNKQMTVKTNNEKSISWFKFHGVLQAACVFLTIISFILIFIHVGSYSHLKTFPYEAHPIMGIMVMVLILLNLLISLYQYQSDAVTGSWMNWLHFFIGSSAYFLSIPTIIIGLQLPASGIKLTKLEYPKWIVIGFSVFQFIIEIVLTIQESLHKLNEDTPTELDMKMETTSGTSLKNDNILKTYSNDSSNRRSKSLILGVYSVIALTVTFVIIIIIALN